MFEIHKMQGFYIFVKVLKNFCVFRILPEMVEFLIV